MGERFGLPRLIRPGRWRPLVDTARTVLAAPTNDHGMDMGGSEWLRLEGLILVTPLFGRY